jgi:hypothetical protein
MLKELLIVKIQFFLQMRYLICDLLLKDVALLVPKVRSYKVNYLVVRNYEVFVLLFDFVKSS